MRGLEVMVAGDEAREHARVGRVGLLADQRQPTARPGVEPKRFQHRDMRMATPEQNQFFGDGKGGRRHTGMIPVRQGPFNPKSTRANQVQINFVRPGMAIGSGSNFMFQSLISGTRTCCELRIISQVSFWPV